MTVDGSPFSDRSWAEGLSRDELISRVEGWTRTAQTSEREIAWLRNALGITDTIQSCAVRDLLAETDEPTHEGAKMLGRGLLDPDEWDFKAATRAILRLPGALRLEQIWREQAQMWERRCNEATSEAYQLRQQVKALLPPQEVLDALEEWLDETNPGGWEATSEQVVAAERWATVKRFRRRALGEGE